MRFSIITLLLLLPHQLVLAQLLPPTGFDRDYLANGRDEPRAQTTDAILFVAEPGIVNWGSAVRIDPWTWITAGHVAAAIGDPTQTVYIRAGANFVTDFSLTERITDVYLHPRAEEDVDLAIIKSSQPFETDDFAVPVATNVRSSRAGEIGAMVGFGTRYIVGQDFPDGILDGSKRMGNNQVIVTPPPEESNSRLINNPSIIVVEMDNENAVEHEMNATGGTSGGGFYLEDGSVAGVMSEVTGIGWGDDSFINGFTDWDIEWFESLMGDPNPGYPGDANRDGFVDAIDLNAVGVHWQTEVGPNGWARGDFDGNGFVDAIDLNELGVNWLTSAPVPTNVRTEVPELTLAVNSVPEPRFSILLVLLLIPALRRRR